MRFVAGVVCALLSEIPINSAASIKKFLVKVASVLVSGKLLELALRRIIKRIDWWDTIGVLSTDNLQINPFTKEEK